MGYLDFKYLNGESVSELLKLNEFQIERNHGEYSTCELHWTQDGTKKVTLRYASRSERHPRLVFKESVNIKTQSDAGSCDRKGC